MTDGAASGFPLSRGQRPTPAPTATPRGTLAATGVSAVPGDWLDSLAVTMKLTALEWRIVASVMARGPVTVFTLAKLLRLDYTLAKQGVRSLATWNIVTRTPAGLVFQPDPKGW